jgi:hypothetical protein
LEKVESALAGEVDRVQSALRDLRILQYTAVSELVRTSDEYQALIEQHAAAWRRLRTIKTALKTVTAAMHGYLP